MHKRPYRPFLISCGLREGFELSAPEHTTNEAREAIKGWMDRRSRENKHICVGTLVQGEFIYPWDSSQESSSRSEPAFQYSGMIQDGSSAEEALEMVTDLARSLAAIFSQKRVHILVESDYYIIVNK